MSPEKLASTSSSSSGGSKESNRRTSKPLMEKKRRARINECLSQLKSLVLEAMKKDSSRHSKLEKADILEMTVRHLRNLHRQYVAMAISADPNVVNKYKAGFSECTNEVTRFLSDADGIDSATRTNIVNHLSNCLQNVTSSSDGAGSPAPTTGSASHVTLPQMQVQIPTLATIPVSAMESAAAAAAIGPVIAPNKEVINNVISGNPGNVLYQQNVQRFANMYGGLRFLPGTGEIALVLPNQGHLSNQIPVIPVYANAVASAAAHTATTTITAATAHAPPTAAAGSARSTESPASSQGCDKENSTAEDISACQCSDVENKSNIVIPTSFITSGKDVLPSTSSTSKTLSTLSFTRPVPSTSLAEDSRAESASVTSHSTYSRRTCKKEPEDTEMRVAPPVVEAQNQAPEIMWRPW